jgi:predicted DNA binding CopG/RHH family protein
MLLMILRGSSVAISNIAVTLKNASSVLGLSMAKYLPSGLPTEVSVYAFLGQDTGEKVKNIMSKQTDYTDEPLEIGEQVKDFLPPPSELVKRKGTVKVTLELTQESVNFFKQQAKQENMPYERILRELIEEAYAKQHGY